MTEEQNLNKLKQCDPDYRVRFWYGFDNHIWNGQVDVRRTCNCLIKVNGELFFGQSMCHPNDYFVKKTARDIALGKAVQNFFNSIPYTLPVPTHIKMD